MDVAFALVARWGFVALLVASTWAMFVPQAARVRRVGAAGVSASAWAAMLAGRAILIVYGAAVGDAVQIVAASVPALCAAVVVVAALAGSSRVERSRTAAWATAAVGVGVLSALTPGALVASVALVTMAVLSAGPQLLVAIRSVDLAGVSALSWVVSAASSAVWAAYGVVGGYGAVIAANFVWLVASVAIVGAVVQSQRGTQPPAGVVPES